MRHRATFIEVAVNFNEVVCVHSLQIAETSVLGYSKLITNLLPTINR
jgi:hypothetical protein